MTSAMQPMQRVVTAMAKSLTDNPITVGDVVVGVNDALVR